MNLSGKHILITGTSSGIGKALASALLTEGAVITSIERTAGAEKRWTSLQADVSHDGGMRRAFAQVKTPIDILVCNAGVMRRGGIFESSEEDFALLMDVNVKGAWLTVKHALPKLAPHAMVVLMSSRHALGLPRDPALYGLSKRYVMDLAEVIGKTYPDLTMKVLLPGPVDTPLARVDVSAEDFREKSRIMVTPEKLAEQIILLLESETMTRLIFNQHTFAHYME